MTPERPSPRQLEQLLQNLEDGSISASDHGWLMALMAEDPAVRREYRRHMRLASALHEESWAHTQRRGGLFPVQADSEGHLPEIHPPRPPLVRWRTRVRAWRQKTAVAPRLLAAAAVVLLAATLAFFFLRPPAPVAMVKASPGTVWKFTSGGLDEKRLFIPGTRVSVEAGTLELRSPEGTRVVLEGPAEYEWKDRMNARLESGQAWFAVAKQDRGFTVRTQRSSIVDLGTEFGVRLVPGEEEVHVGIGKVVVQPSVSGISPVQVSAGEAVSGNRQGSTHPIPCEPARFIHAIAERTPFIRWSFDETDGKGFTAQSVGMDNPPLMLVAPNGASVPLRGEIEGRFGKAVDLAAAGAFLRSNFEGILGSVPRTVAMWIRSDGFPTRKLSTGKNFHPSLLHWGFVSGGSKWNLVTPPSGQSWATVWGDSWMVAPLPENGTLFDGRWHHVVSVFTGHHDEKGRPEIRHFVDGVLLPNTAEVVLGPVNTRRNTMKPERLVIGLEESPEHPKSVLPMQVDEVVVVRRALDSAMIERLYRTNELIMDEP